jgi:hypothetical protein
MLLRCRDRPAWSCTASDDHRRYLLVTSVRIRPRVSAFEFVILAPQRLHTRWLTTSGTGNRFGTCDSG